MGRRGDVSPPRDSHAAFTLSHRSDRPGRRLLPDRRAGSGQVADQGHRLLRGRSREPVDRLRHRRGPQRHRRQPAQRSDDQAEPRGHAGAAGRQCPRQQPEHQEHRRRHGHGQPAAVLGFGLEGRRHRLDPGRRQEPLGRHPAGHQPAGRGRPDLCGRPRHRADRFGLGRRRLGQLGDQGRADGRPHHAAAASSSARPASRWSIWTSCA